MENEKEYKILRRASVAGMVAGLVSVGFSCFLTFTEPNAPSIVMQYEKIRNEAIYLNTLKRDLPKNIDRKELENIVNFYELDRVIKAKENNMRGLENIPEMQSYEAHNKNYRTKMVSTFGGGFLVTFLGALGLERYKSKKKKK
jgi:hypothetical protein